MTLVMWIRLQLHQPMDKLSYSMVQLLYQALFRVIQVQILIRTLERNPQLTFLKEQIFTILMQELELTSKAPTLIWVRIRSYFLMFMQILVICQVLHLTMVCLHMYTVQERHIMPIMDSG